MFLLLWGRNVMISYVLFNGSNLVAGCTRKKAFFFFIKLRVFVLVCRAAYECREKKSFLFDLPGFSSLFEAFCFQIRAIEHTSTYVASPILQTFYFFC